MKLWQQYLALSAGFLVLGIVALYASAYVLHALHEAWYGFPTFVLSIVSCFLAIAMAIASGMMAYEVYEEEEK